MENPDQILDYQEDFQDPEVFLAPTGIRRANFILDRIGIYIFTFLVVFLIESSSMLSEYGQLSDLGVVVMILIVPAYYIVPEYLFGKSPAKFLTRTKVVTQNGEKPTFLNIVGRTLCRFIPFEAFSFLGSRPVGWHDSISKTRVVRDDYRRGLDLV